MQLEEETEELKLQYTERTEELEEERAEHKELLKWNKVETACRLTNEAELERLRMVADETRSGKSVRPVG